MIRLTGAVMLAAGAAALGLAAVARLEGRVRDLRGAIAGLEGMRLALTSCLAPLDEMLSAAAEAAEGRARAVFSYCGEGLKKSGRQRFGALWYAALEELPLCLEEQDLEALRPLGGVLGRYDGDSQAQALSRSISLLKGQLDSAVEQRRSQGKVYGTVGISVGLFLAILLI